MLINMPSYRPDLNLLYSNTGGGFMDENYYYYEPAYDEYLYYETYGYDAFGNDLYSYEAYAPSENLYDYSYDPSYLTDFNYGQLLNPSTSDQYYDPTFPVDYGDVYSPELSNLELENISSSQLVDTLPGQDLDYGWLEYEYDPLVYAMMQDYGLSEMPDPAATLAEWQAAESDRILSGGSLTVDNKPVGGGAVSSALSALGLGGGSSSIGGGSKTGSSAPGTSQTSQASSGLNINQLAVMLKSILTGSKTESEVGYSQAQLAAMIAQKQNQSSFTSLLPIAGIGLVAYLILRK